MLLLLRAERRAALAAGAEPTPMPTSAGRSAGAASPQTPMSSDRSRSSWLDPCHERESAFAKPVVRSRRERLPELGRVRSISPMQGPAGNEAVGRGERYLVRVHGLTRTTAAVLTIAILGLMAIMLSPMGPWITGVDLGGVLLAIAALTVLSVWASRP